ncbi:Alstrom syndrome [Mactra antiquata]
MRINVAQVWFTLPPEFSPDLGPSGNSQSRQQSPAFCWHNIETLQDASNGSDGSDISSSFCEPKRFSLKGQDLSQYPLRPSMDNQGQSETVSTNDSPDISTSQQESTMSDGQYGYDDGNSTSSIHDSPQDEAVSTAIMELSGELMLGQYSRHKPTSGGSESSDISDDEARRQSSGVIAKYPESSTGLSDNDWNPYATESDTNQTPRSPRSVASDDQNRVGYISKATFSIAQPKESTATISMATGKVTVDEGKDSTASGKNGKDNLDILRYVIDDDGKKDEDRRNKVKSPEDDVRGQTPDTLRSGYSEGSRSGRQSTESGQSADTLRRESAESAGSFKSDRSGRQSVESGQSGRSSRSDLDQSGGSGQSGRQSADSQGSQKSTGRTSTSDRSERLDRLKDSAGDNIKELMQFESSQRFTAAAGGDTNGKKDKDVPLREYYSGDTVLRTRLTAKLEPYAPPVQFSKSPEYSSNMGRSGYISIAERERILNDSNDVVDPAIRVNGHRDTGSDQNEDIRDDRSRPVQSSNNIPTTSLDSFPHRSPSEVSMRRVSNLFEETKRQVREAVAVPRPEPSGSEERFPLSERISIPRHEDSFKDKSSSNEGKFDKSRDSENARSLTSEEVARVLSKYADEAGATSTDDKGYPKLSVYDKDGQESQLQRSGETPRRYETPDSVQTEDLSDDEISRRVRALIAQTGNYNRNTEDGKPLEYVPRTIDYSRLQRDLQEIQDSLQDVPQPTANDSIHVQRRNQLADRVKGDTEDTLSRDDPRLLENTNTTVGGRESGASEYGRRLVWDYGADLEYDKVYDGQFIGTMATTGTDTMSSIQFQGTSGSNTLVRPDSAVSSRCDHDIGDFEGTKTLTGSDITRAEKIVEQVMNRRAEGDLKESVEDIIARYRNERRDLFDRLQNDRVQAPSETMSTKISNELNTLPVKPLAEREKPILNDPDVVLPPSERGHDEDASNKKQKGLAERVYKILTSEGDNAEDSDVPTEKGMAKQVYKILASDRPQEQVNGILSETMATEHELLKQLVSRPKNDSSLDDSGLNGTPDESFVVEDKDIRKQLEYSQFSSPGKGDKSDLTALREVTSAPYSSLSNAKSLLSTQLKKMSERNFDKSVELRTPYRQTVDCYPVYGIDLQSNREPEEPREAWMPARRSAADRSSSNRDSALASERFYITERDNVSRDIDRNQHRSRTHSDPFDISPSRLPVSRVGHVRSRSEEAGNVSDISQYSFVEPTYSPVDRRSNTSPRSLKPEGLSTPQIHRPQDYRPDGSPSPTESDTSTSRRATKVRPYRPADSRDVYYTESGAEDTNESGTTVESTHIGSDDAAPPYIPSQYLGTRRDEPSRHPTGIYGNKDNKDALSTIDEQSVKDEKERAFSASGGSLKDGAGSDRRSVVTTDTGYQTATIRSRSPVSQRDDLDTVGQSAGRLERPGFKTREEYQRDFEQREKELKELLSKRQPINPSRDSLGTSTRSDPGGTFDEPESNWEYRVSDQNEFQRLEPEPAYPQDRLRYSRSKSDTDLVALSPTESQRYSSPMQPGTRFLELSTQPSPIFHQDSMSLPAPARSGTRNIPEDLPRVPIEREIRSQQLPPAQELPKVYDRRPVTQSSSERIPEAGNNPVRPLESVEPPIRPLEPGDKYKGQRSNDVLDPVDLGADPRKLGPNRRMPGESSNRNKSNSPSLAREKEMEQELDKLNKQLSAEVDQIQEKNPDNDKPFEDNFPPSKKAQVLREVLEQEYDDRLPPNINDMWTRFKERKEQSMTESSLDSTRLHALSGLLNNPTHHSMKSFVEEKKEKLDKQKTEEREMMEKLREEKTRERELDKKKQAEKAAEQRSQRRQELKQRHGLSEEESNGSYSEILLENERKKAERREERAERKLNKERDRSPKKKQNRDAKVMTSKERRKKTRDEASETDIRARNVSNKHSDTMDTLFSIPEDASFEQSPTKAESEMKSRQKRQRHVIDPLMKKLRDKIKMQRVKIDKERRKELQRVEKLKKLEMLLNAKRKGKLSDKAIDVELHDVSSTTTVIQSESSGHSEFTLTGVSTELDSDLSTNDSTTLKDSTLDSQIKLQVKQYHDDRKSHVRNEYKSPSKRYVELESDSTTETSDFSNIIVERLPERKSERKSKDRKTGSKGKKYKVDEYGNRICKEKVHKKKGVFGVEFTEKDIANQIKKYEKYMTPEKQRQVRLESYLAADKRRMQDASTMYPSPVTISPPSRRRMREVLMKSEAIQTSPSIRSSSPTHAYDEVPVAPVPYMTAHGQRSSRRRPSPSPTRSNQTSFSSSPPRPTSRSPARKSSRSPAVTRRRTSPQITRKQAQSPIWKPESEIITPPPENSMFTPEGDENSLPTSQQKKEAETWFIPMKPSQPWRQPLKERQAFSVRQETWEPKTVSQSTWKNIVHGNVLKDKTDPNDVSRDTKFDLDPEGHVICDESSSESEDDISRSKPLNKMSLQEAFQACKAVVISRLRERQKRLNLAAEQRKMEVYLKMERDRLFQEERKKEANPDAHPYSDQLHKPARRVISKEEMREITEKKYKKLPEVLERQKRQKREQEYSLNRIKARLFNRKVQKKVLVRADKWGR